MYVCVSHSSINKFLNLTLPIAEKYDICKNVSLTCKHEISSDDDTWKNLKEKLIPEIEKLNIWVPPYYKAAVYNIFQI